MNEAVAVAAFASIKWRLIAYLFQVVEELFEHASAWEGEPIVNVGERKDVLKCAKSVEGLAYFLHQSAQVIAVPTLEGMSYT